MSPVIELGGPLDTARRSWVIGLDPSIIHKRVLFGLICYGSTITGVGFGEPPGGPGLTEVLAHLQRVLDGEMPPPGYVEGSALSIILPRLKADLRAHGRPECLPLHEALPLLERLVINPFVFPKYGRLTKLSKKSDISLQTIYEIARIFDAFSDQWIAGCLLPLDRDGAFLAEYQQLLQDLSQLASSGEVLRRVLLELMDSPRGLSGRLNVNSWTCDLPLDWKARCVACESPSDWAEALMAIKYETHTRAIKERLARANCEQHIVAAWGAYGAWLSQHPHALGQLEVLLGGLKIGSLQHGALSAGSPENR